MLEVESQWLSTSEFTSLWLGVLGRHYPSSSSALLQIPGSRKLEARTCTVYEARQLGRRPALCIHPRAHGRAPHIRCNACTLTLHTPMVHVHASITAPPLQIFNNLNRQSLGHTPLTRVSYTRLPLLPSRCRTTHATTAAARSQLAWLDPHTVAHALALHPHPDAAPAAHVVVP